MRLLIAVSAVLCIAAPAMADSPDDLPAQVAGVIGSGASLTLKFKPVIGQPTRILSQGDVYADGWVLTGLTPSIATLTKDGQSRMIGLNPTGVVDQPAPVTPASEVTVIFSAADLAYLNGEIANGHWDNKPFTGLTLDQTRRLMLYDKKLEEGRLRSPGNAGSDVAKAVLGADYIDYLSTSLDRLMGERQAGLDRGDINAVRSMDGLPPVGPDKILVPAGTSPDEAFRAAGLVSRTGYAEQGPAGSLDADGNRTFTRGTVGMGLIPTGQAALQAALASQNATR